MPSPHFRVEVITRSNGQSVVAAAAYRSGEVLYDEKTGKTFDYSRKEDVIHTEIMAPANVPAWATDRSKLWNITENTEKRSDARLARSIIAGLPRELSHEQNIQLVQGFVQENFVAKGMVADVAIHESAALDGESNPHVHILLTTRDISQNGFGQKNRSWDHKNALYGWRGAWEAHTNQQLELAGCPERVSLKSYKDRKINRHPTVHLGENAGNLEKRGIKTQRGNQNRRINHENDLIEMYGPASEDGDQGFERESGQPSAYRFLHPQGRLEAMTLELKEDREEYGDQKSEGGNQKSENGIGQNTEDDKNITLGAFKRKDNDMQKLAESSLSASMAAHEAALFGEMRSAPYEHPDPDRQASLEAARAVHEAGLDDYLEPSQYAAAKEQTLQKVRLQEYARLTAERARALGQRVKLQFGNLMKETSRIKAKEREEERER